MRFIQISFALIVALAGCAKKDVAVDYGRVFDGSTPADVQKFTEESGLMGSADWEVYAIGYDAFLAHCTQDDLYFRRGVCNLEQIRGAKAHTLFWQFLLMGERVLNEEAVAQVRRIEASSRIADELKIDRSDLKRLEDDPLAQTILRISQLRRFAEQFDRIQALKEKMPRE